MLCCGSRLGGAALRAAPRPGHEKTYFLANPSESITLRSESVTSTTNFL